MFGSIGFQELVIILIVAHVIIGPKRLPELAKTIGRSLRDFKRATSDIQDQINLDDDLDDDYTQQEDKKEGAQPAGEIPEETSSAPGTEPASSSSPEPEETNPPGSAPQERAPSS